MKLFFALLGAFLLIGCSDTQEEQPEAQINKLLKPVTVVAASTDYGVMVAGSDGSVVYVYGNRSLAKLIWENGYKPKDILIPAPPGKPLPAVEKALVEPR